MSDLPKIEEIIPTEESREVYNILISFKMPQQATITLAAKNREHATELALEQASIAGYTDCKVHDIYLMSDIVAKERKAVEQYNRMMAGDFSDDDKIVTLSAKEIN